MLSSWVGAGAALDGRRLFDLADARKIVISREEKANERFARALAKAPRLEDVIPQAEGVDSAWRVVKSTLAAPSWNPSLRVPLTTLDAALLSLEYKTAFPNPVHKVLSSIHKDS